ncbi:MAG: hypothetical protein JNL83_00180 [Myxococcales bacterium]|nr:hypothetical protein [Myxococcales bacterium]
MSHFASASIAALYSPHSAGSSPALASVGLVSSGLVSVGLVSAGLVSAGLVSAGLVSPSAGFALALSASLSPFLQPVTARTVENASTENNVVSFFI